MLLIGIGLRVLAVLVLIYVFLPLITRLLDVGFLGRSRNGSFFVEFAKRAFIYLFLPVLLATTSTGLFQLTNPEFMKALGETVPVKTSPFPTTTEIAENEQRFPSAKKAFIGGVIGAVLIVGLARIVAVSHAAFLTRTVYFLTVGACSSFLLFLLMELKALHVFIDVVARGFAPQLALPSLVSLLLVGVGVEGGLYFHTREWGYQPGEKVPKGVYVCKRCLRPQYIETDQDRLQYCTCRYGLFRREK